MCATPAPDQGDLTKYAAPAPREQREGRAWRIRWERRPRGSWEAPRGRRRMSGRQPALQLTPLRANEAGAAALPVWVAWNPIWVVPPGASVPL